MPLRAIGSMSMAVLFISVIQISVPVIYSEILSYKSNLHSAYRTVDKVIYRYY